MQLQDSEMHDPVRIQLFPTKEQFAAIRNHADTCRFLYNLLLEKARRRWKTKAKPLFYGDMAHIITSLKKSPYGEFLREVNSQSLQQTAMNLSTAFVNFCKYDAEEPKFHLKRGGQSFSVPQHYAFLDGNKVKIPKVGIVKTARHRPVTGKMLAATIRITKTGKVFFVVGQVVSKPVAPEPKKDCISIDIGVKNLVTIYDGKNFEKVDNPKYFKKSERRLSKLRKRLSKQEEGSGRWRRTKREIASASEKEKNRSTDFLHKLTTRLARESQAIIAEDLDVKGLLEKKRGERKQRHERRNAREIQQARFATILTMLKYKCAKYGRQFVQTDQYFPSSKKCSTPGCPYIKRDLMQGDREWTCPTCHKHHDRDENACVNLYDEGQKILHSGVGTPSEVKPKALGQRQRLSLTRSRKAEAAVSSAQR